MMLCHRCNREIDDKETICPYCQSEVDLDVEYNDYESDGFLHIKVKEYNEEAEETVEKVRKDKYIKISYLNMFITCFVFLLVVAVMTIFASKLMLYMSNDTAADVSVPVYVPEVTMETEEAPIKNEVEELSIENLYGSWKIKGTKKTEKFAIPYYSFTEKGVVQYDHGSFSATGYFEDYSNEKSNRVYIELEEKLNGMFSFSVKGNKKDGYELKLKNVQTKEVYYLQTAKAVTYDVKPDEEFDPDKKIIGTWKSKEGNKTYIFEEDGKFTRTMDVQMMKGVWTRYNKKTLQLKYMESSITYAYVKYDVYDDVLVVNNVIYNRSE